MAKKTPAQCPDCEEEISPTAKKCKHCGARVRRDVGILLGLGIFFIPFIFSFLTLRRGHSIFSRMLAFFWFVCVFLWAFGGTPEERAHRDTINFSVLSGEKAPTKEEMVTLHEFNSLDTGMTYWHVTQIIGAEGKLTAKNEIGDLVTEMYEWRNGLSAMNATFQDGKLVSKAQFGLR